MKLSLSLIVLVITGIHALAAEPALSVGFSDVDITPTLGKKPVLMAGFGHNRIATKVHDPLMARAVVLSDGTNKIALVAVDLVGFFLPNVETVRTKLSGFQYVMISATHNHEGPDTLGLWGASPFQNGIDPEYLKLVEEMCAKAVTQADASRKPATAKIGTAKGLELLHDGRQPIVKHDDIVTIQFESSETKSPLGILVQWNCHPETMGDKNTEITTDYVYATVKHLQDAHKCPVAYFTGTVGGLMTSLHVEVKDATGKLLQDGTWEKTELYGKLVGQLADKAIKNAETIRLTPFAVRTKSFLIPVDNNVYRLGKQLGVLNRVMFAYDGNPTPEKYIERQDVTKPVGIRTEIGYLKLGDLEVAAIPGEIYPELVLGKVQDPVDPGADFPDAPIEPSIYGNFKSKHRMIFGLANDELGYFIPKRQWDEKAPYCYGLKKSQYGEINSMGPETAPIICGMFRDLVKSASAPK